LVDAIRFVSTRAVLVAAVCAAAFGGAFADDKPKQPMPPWQIQFPLDQTFSLRELNGKPVPDSLDVSLKIDGSFRGTGYTGCNSWSATIYPVRGQKLALGPPALTKKQCDKDTMAVEVGFLSALVGQPSWDLINGELIIKGPHGTLKMVRSL
jgi:heat shock protein HslJ